MGGEMPNVAGQDTIAFLFPETEWWKTNPQTNQAALGGCRSLLLPGREHEASIDWGFCCGCQLCSASLSAQQNTPCSLRGPWVPDLPSAHGSLEPCGEW